MKSKASFLASIAMLILGVFNGEPARAMWAASELSYDAGSDWLSGYAGTWKYASWEGESAYCAGWNWDESYGEYCEFWIVINTATSVTAELRDPAAQLRDYVTDLQDFSYSYFPVGVGTPDPFGEWTLQSDHRGDQRIWGQFCFTPYFCVADLLDVIPIVLGIGVARAADVDLGCSGSTTDAVTVQEYLSSTFSESRPFELIAESRCDGGTVTYIRYGDSFGDIFGGGLGITNDPCKSLDLPGRGWSIAHTHPFFTEYPETANAQMNRGVGCGGINSWNLTSTDQVVSVNNSGVYFSDGDLANVMNGAAGTAPLYIRQPRSSSSMPIYKARSIPIFTPPQVTTVYP